jgi:protein gp37
VSDKTGIEWTQSDDGTPGATWNPVTGCDDVSPGCQHCYARTFAERWRGTPGHHFERGFDVVLRPERLDQPLRWNRPRRIFVNSMSDLFHKDVPDEYIARVFAVMAMASQHTFMVLTKRHARMRSFLQDDCRCGKGHVPGIHLRSAMDWAGTPHSPTYVPGVVGHDVYHCRQWPLPNVWLGVSAEDQHWADIRIPALLDTPAAVRFVSAEPLLGPINLGAWLGQMWKCRGCGGINGQRTGSAHCFHCGTRNWPLPVLALDWLICGGESGPGARPMEAEWARSIVSQCRDEFVPVFMKQLGSVLGKQLGAGSKGGDMSAWPEDLRIREFPRVTEMRAA